MEGEWPLVGRTAELERVDGLLRRRAGGVVLAGPAGVGKTRLAGECLALAGGRGFVPIRVSATQAAAHLPLGAFAPLLPDLAADADRAEVLRQVGRSIIERGQGDPVALLVDDAHLLDKSSATLFHQLAAGEKAFVLATVRSGEPASDAVVAVWKDGLAERIEVGPLSRADVNELLAAVLGDPVDGATAHHFYERSEGNLLFLKELVLAGLDSGVLGYDAGLWRLDGNPAPSSRLVELVESRLSGLGDTERLSLEVLALGEPLGVDLVAQMGDGALHQLERRQLVRVEQSGRRLEVGLGHPLYGDVLRARLSPLRSREVCRSLAETVEATGARRREDSLRVATWRLEGGGSASASLTLEGARTARLLWDIPLAERLASAAVESGAGFDAGLLLGQLHWLQGRCEDAEHILAPLVGLATDDLQRATLATARMDNFFRLGLTAEAMAVGEEAEACVAEAACRDEIMAKRSFVLAMSGQVKTAVDVVEPLLVRSEGRTLASACFSAAFSLVCAGRCTASLRAAEKGFSVHRALAGVPMTIGSHSHLANRCIALAFSGRLQEAEALARSEHARAITLGTFGTQVLFSYYLASILVDRGRPADAAHFGREAVSMYRKIRWPLMLRSSLIFLGHACAARADQEGAKAVLAEIDALGLPYDIMQAELLRLRAWTEVASGHLAGAWRLLEDAVVHARENGQLTWETRTLHDLARLGQAKQVTARLSELSSELDGDLVAGRAAHVAALATGNAAGLESASARFEAMGADLLAAEAAADAAVAWRKAGDPRKAAATERRAHALAARCEGARTPALTAVTARAALSARELEIARLAAAGVPNKEIASRLYLSLHTVQNKLHTAYEKLGVDGRAELAEALEGY